MESRDFKNLTLRELTQREIRAIYLAYMLEDFPDSERKPLSMILRGIKKNRYVCFGAYDGEALIGYAFFAIAENENYLLDYYAILRDLRDKGYGSRILQLLSERFKGMGSVIIEAENPEYENDFNQKKIQLRRYDFYIRNGIIDTKVTAKVFGVEYCVLELPVGNEHTVEQIREIYEIIYHSMIPEKLYRKNILIR